MELRDTGLAGEEGNLEAARLQAAAELRVPGPAMGRWGAAEKGAECSWGLRCCDAVSNVQQHALSDSITGEGTTHTAGQGREGADRMPVDDTDPVHG